MALVVRIDLGMTKGKIAAQCGHASVGCYKKAKKHTPIALNNWEEYGCTKIATKCPSLEELLDIEMRAKSEGLITYKVADAGMTQIEPGSITVLAIGPAPIKVIDSITNHLRLL